MRIENIVSRLWGKQSECWLIIFYLSLTMFTGFMIRMLILLRIVISP